MTMTGNELEMLRAQIARLEARLDDQAAVVADLEGGLSAGDASSAAAPPAALRFPSVEAWVTEWLSPTVEREPSANLRWCRQWWAHPEALARLEALWRAWEQLRQDPMVGMSNWYRDHLDHHLPLLVAEQGPFASCSPDRHDPDTSALPVSPAPADWWNGVEDARHPHAILVDPQEATR